MIFLSEEVRQDNLDMLALIVDPNDIIPELKPSFRGFALIHGKTKTVLEYPLPYTDEDISTELLLTWFKMSIT
jgi:hypothetical protein